MFVNRNLLVLTVKLVTFEGVTCSFVGVTFSFERYNFLLWDQNNKLYYYNYII
jgi:hypothetical protein